MSFRVLFAALVALAVSGCVTASNTLSPDQVSTLRLQAVTVQFAPGASVWWGEGERAFAASKGLSVAEAEAAAGTPEGQAYIRNTIAAKLKNAMESRLAGDLTGSRSVKVEVAVKGVHISSAAQRILLGGDHRLVADVTIVDAKTGAPLLAFSQQAAVAMAGQGIGGVLVDNAFLADPIDRVIQNYASQYQNWLLRK